MKPWSFAAIMVAFVLGIIAVHLWDDQRGRPPEEPQITATASDTTIVIHDTVFIPAPPIESVSAGQIAARVPIDKSQEPGLHHFRDSTKMVADTTGARRRDQSPDSIDVLLDIEQRHYTGDQYEAWVSGITTPDRRPELDSIRIRIPERTITTTNEVTRWKTKRWGLSVGAGVVASPKGVQPGIFIGASYTFLAF